MPISNDPYVKAQRLPLSRACDAIRPTDDARDSRDAVLAWQAHVDAGRIGTPTPLSPELRANLEATERALGIARRSGAMW